jgi:hypothetical protein
MDDPADPADPEPASPGPSEPDDAATSRVERPVDRFRRTAAGTAIAAGMFGLRDALEGRPEREETVMEVPAPAALADDDLDVVVDLDHPENARVVIRRPAEPPHPS